MSDAVAQKEWRIAGDIGGTFTDLILVDPSGACRAVAKVLTTSDEPAQGLETGIVELLAHVDEEVTVGTVVHGTTLVANALIERRGARTALVTTEGFQDVLEMGRELRYDLYDLDIVLPEPLVPRQWRFEVSERIYADGTIATPLDEDGIRSIADQLKAEGIESVAVTFLHSYQRPDHEHRAAELLHELAPDIDVTTSADVLPQLGEYARASTAAANAYTRPLVRSYVADLKERISSRLRSADLSLVVSTGRVAPAGTAVGVPIRLVESGPAGGVLAAAATARSIGVGNALAFDMGGTTAKAAYITNGEPRHTDTFEVARVNRFVKGSGLPIQVPSIELVEIGAGGGSVAWVDRLGLLRVGPRSSGSEPGPACYGSGGTEPTVTDADLILGYLDSGSFLGGTMSLDTEAAVEALSALAQVIGLKDPVEAAQAVRRVVDEQMAAAARMHAIEQGLDPTQYTLVATGGAGPLHAFSVARILRSGRMVSPARAGVASAHGFLGAPFGFDVARSAPGMLADMDWHRVLDLLDELENEARQKVGRIDGTRRIEADLRYRGQGATVTISVPADLEPGSAAAGLQHELEAEYRRRYGRVPDGVEPEILTWRLSYSSEPPQVFPAPTDGARQETSRRVWFEEAGEYLPTRVVGRADADGIGPMIIEERESTLVVPPGATVELLAHSVVAVSL